ncbi:hypothetical protein DENSPDRAFT_887421 [Dentipellis sp. KUC8613]|nr:hypothetical protein DENSPDRAFT_887421 [Dentipellis sp. KUC8613]
MSETTTAVPRHWRHPSCGAPASPRTPMAPTRAPRAHARRAGTCVGARTSSPALRATASPPPTHPLRLSPCAGVALPATFEPAILD